MHHSLINAATSVQDLDHWVHLNQAAPADIACWCTFLTVWNGTSAIPLPNEPLNLSQIHQWAGGCGALYAGLLFQLKWPGDWATVSIAPKELVPTVMAVIPPPLWVYGAQGYFQGSGAGLHTGLCYGHA